VETKILERAFMKKRHEVLNKSMMMVGSEMEPPKDGKSFLAQANGNSWHIIHWEEIRGCFVVSDTKEWYRFRIDHWIRLE
jgi:hypothetical protein